MSPPAQSRGKPSWLARFWSRFRPTLPPPTRFHSLRDTQNLTPAGHAQCLELIRRVEAIFRNWEPFVAAHALDPAIFYPNNEWRSLVGTKDYTFYSDYPRLNYLRLYAPFTGFFLLFLDRTGPGKHFPDDWSQLQQDFYAADPPADLADTIHRGIDPLERVAHAVADFRDHVESVPQRFWFKAPRICGEMGAECGPYLVSDDVVTVQARLNAMHAFGILERLESIIRRKGYCRIVEIGPGAGSQAASLRAILGPRLQFVTIDLPPVLFYSGMYLSRLVDFEKCHFLQAGEPWPSSFNFVFLANYLIESFRRDLAPADLVFNTMSFGEMSEGQVHYYGQLAAEILGRDGLLYEENCQAQTTHVPVPTILARSFKKCRHLTPGKIVVRHGCHRLWSNA